MPTLFNGCGFGPPKPFTAPSAWTWIDHPVSGLHYLTLALLRLGFPSAPQLNCLTSPDSITRRTVLQKVRGCAVAVHSLLTVAVQLLPSFIASFVGYFMMGEVLCTSTFFAPDPSPCKQARYPFRKKTLYSNITLPQFVNTGFQVLFHSPPGVLFTFPSQYYALSVTKEYLALRSGLRAFRQGFSCLVLLWILPCYLPFRLRGFHPLRPVFPGPFCYSQ